MQKTILIVDDDKGLLTALVMILKKNGYAIETSVNGEVLMDNLTRNPDLILLDKQLSGMDGMKICKHLKKQEASREIPVILFSATPGLEGIAKDAGADDFIEKPFSIRELLDKVARLM